MNTRRVECLLWKYRRRAEEALARTVAAAHAQLTQKQEALAHADQARASEYAARSRIQVCFYYMFFFLIYLFIVI